MTRTRSKIVARTVVFMFALAATLATPAARAGAVTPCSNAFIFSGSDVNLIVLPYVLDGPDEEFRLRPGSSRILSSKIARSLASVIQLDTLYSLRYPAGMATIHLIADGTPCDAEAVRKRIDPQLDDGKGVVFLWGSFLEENGQIYVQSYLEFFRKGRSERLEIAVPVLGGKTVLFSGAPAQQALGFAPRILTKEDLAGIASAADVAREVWSAPVGGTVEANLPAEPYAAFAYYVTEIDFVSGRMRIHPVDGVDGPEGWLAAKTDWPLRQKLPELEFVDAVMGYLAARIIIEEQQNDHWAGPWEQRFDQTKRRSKEVFERFRKMTSAGLEEEDFDARVSFALSHALTGLLELSDPLLVTGRQDEARARFNSAVQSFSAASTVIPYQSGTRNLEAIARVGLVFEDVKEAANAIREWREALSLDPGNTAAAGNLMAFYRFLLEIGKPELSGLPEHELKARLDGLER